ncbi:FAD-dependent oxidoreductase [Hwanghaeella grinnelliae]|uniref:FAD-dependent oxidoreductase n=1 Tax=Hwanghaeella grinnelliae TaxID=2500179 RepID=A0A3S3ULQ8_9PROT|nr:FAD-dependent oxidoreductase [Hwanghaeella grinnelliae]RVU34217.1 FAD-dependent oxidoreductase [Hwanghaeella grinnelliae]
MTGQYDSSYDVIVAGGGSAGVAAAVASARTGARTLLIERYGCLGGAATMRNVVTYCGLYTLGDPPRRAVRGIADEVTHALKKRGAITDPIRHRGVYVVFEPEAVKLTLDELAGEAGVDVMLGAFVTAADREDGAITSVTVAGHDGYSKFKAEAFVDCTGDGDLAAFGGASTRYGNGADVNLGTLGTRFGGIPRDLQVTALDVAKAVADKGFAPGEVTKDRSVVARLPVSGDMVIYVVSADYDPRDARSMSAAEAYGRRQAWAYLEAVRTIPGCEGAYLVATGPEFGTRESRHLNCRGQLTWADVQAGRGFDDTIALGAWGAEWHDRGNYASSFDFAPDKSTYEIPLSCLHSVDTANLFCAGRLADGDRLGGAAIRVMGTAMATGQAAGIAAALTADGSFDPAEVRSRLRKEGAVLDGKDAVA